MFFLDKRIKLRALCVCPERTFNKKIQWRRHNRGYIPAWDIAWAILGKKNGLEHGNQKMSFSYFFDMAEIWEMFLYKRLKKVISDQDYKGLVIESPRLERPNADCLMEKYQRKFRGLIPDFILKKGDAFIGILDAKYKHLINEWHYSLPKNDDITQMALYQSHYMSIDDRNNKAVPGALLYPRRRVGQAFNDFHLKGKNNNFDEGTLNITNCKPKLSWWLVDIECQRGNEKTYISIENFKKNVDKILREVLKWLLDNQ